MKIKVYAGNDTASEKIAEFYDESVYEECMEVLESWATANGWSFIFEDVEEEDEYISERLVKARLEVK